MNCEQVDVYFEQIWEHGHSNTKLAGPPMYSRITMGALWNAVMTNNQYGTPLSDQGQLRLSIIYKGLNLPCTLANATIYIAKVANVRTYTQLQIQ